jgi:hypothetical protein
MSLREGFNEEEKSKWYFPIGVSGWVPGGIIFQLKNKNKKNLLQMIYML